MVHCVVSPTNRERGSEHRFPQVCFGVGGTRAVCASGAPRWQVLSLWGAGGEQGQSDAGPALTPKVVRGLGQAACHPHWEDAVSAKLVMEAVEAMGM